MTKALQSFIVVLLLCPYVSADYKDSKAKDLIVQQVIYGKSFLGKNLIGFKIFKPMENVARVAAVITGGVHGNEYMGIASGISHLFYTPSGKQKFENFFQAGGVLFIAPQVNPDGIARRNRYTMLGKDLNRDFDFNGKGKFLEHQESFYLVKWVEHELKQLNAQLVMAMDYHCCANALIYPEVQKSKEQPLYQNIYQTVFQALRKNIKRDFKMGVTKEIFGNTTEGTLKDYWYTEYGAASFTYEGDKPSLERKFFDQHVSWWGDILNAISGLSSHQLAELKLGAGTQALAHLRKQSFKAYSE